MTISYLNPISDPMKYKGDFIGLNLKEDKAIIESLVKSFPQRHRLSQAHQQIIDTAIKVMLNNYELKRTTFDELMNAFANIGLKPIEFHSDSKGGHFWGGCYDIPANDRTLALKKLSSRSRKRMKAWKDAWFIEFGVTYSPEEVADVGSYEEHVKTVLGSSHDLINSEQEPKDVKVLPFVRKQ